MTENTTSLWDTLRDDNREKAIYRQAAAYAQQYMDDVDHRPVYPTDDALAGLARFDEPLPDGPHDAQDIIRLLHEAGSPATVAQGGGRYFGFVNGGIIPAALAARWLADAWDQNGALHVMSPVAAKLEQLCEQWLVDLFGLPEGTAAGFVNGTSTATMCGLLAGRNELLRRAGWDVAEQGLFGAPPLRVVMSEQSHGSVRKGLAIIGMGRAQIESVPMDDQGRLRLDALPPLDDRTLIVLQAANVNSGAFEAFTEVCKRAQQAGAWVHVDGAFGLWAAASKQTRHLTAGMELADSWSVDAHKTLNAPYDCGVVLCRDRQTLVNALQASGSYLQFSEERDSMLYTLDMSRRARGIELWALLKNMGRSGVDALIVRLCDNAKLFETELKAHGFEIPNEVVFNQVMVKCETPELTQRTLQYIQQGGECWCGGSKWFGEPVIRISVCSWVTTTEDVRRSVAAFVDAREKAWDEVGA
ncbi:MAG: aminotransferase class V-fold PLP-dependent enzyme [Chloroflexota bacterium]